MVSKKSLMATAHLLNDLKRVSMAIKKVPNPNRTPSPPLAIIVPTCHLLAGAAAADPRSTSCDGFLIKTAAADAAPFWRVTGALTAAPPPITRLFQEVSGGRSFTPSSVFEQPSITGVSTAAPMTTRLFQELRGNGTAFKHPSFIPISAAAVLPINRFYQEAHGDGAADASRIFMRPPPMFTTGVSSNFQNGRGGIIADAAAMDRRLSVLSYNGGRRNFSGRTSENPRDNENPQRDIVRQLLQQVSSIEDDLNSKGKIRELHIIYKADREIFFRILKNYKKGGVVQEKTEEKGTGAEKAKKELEEGNKGSKGVFSRVAEFGNKAIASSTPYVDMALKMKQIFPNKAFGDRVKDFIMRHSADFWSKLKQLGESAGKIAQESAGKIARQSAEKSAGESAED